MTGVLSSTIKGIRQS